MIRQLYLQQVRRFVQPSGQGIVLRAGAHIPRRMVMAKDDPRSQRIDSRFEDDTEVGGGFPCSALADLCLADHFAGPVGQGYPQFFVR